ncbi:FRG domain-containing protein [Fusobacterium massiliense]|uniref:FRG domain-containing protein n=1 Tax=Fusobacterium massiliense TaxID=1852365 RepID=UPI00093E50A8|nr:FRG domain-containing protein [Fusobacterium massiliense]
MNKIYVDKVYYSEKENIDDAEYNKISYTVRKIRSVSDYLRAVETILSNYYICGDFSPIKRFENLFYLRENKLKSIMQEGVFFRGQSEEFEFIIPSIFRDTKYIENEHELIKEAEISYPLEIQKIKYLPDKLALMQHYGLPTRIMDITTNALVALYFAVSKDKDKDGVVYLFNKKTNKKEVLTSKSIPVIIKTVLANLTYKEKLLLDLTFRKIKNKEILLSSFRKVNYRILPIIGKIYDAIKTDIGFIPTNIKISDFYGLNFVKPLEVDERIIRQNAMFMIFGLDGIYDSHKEGLKQLKVDSELIGKRAILESYYKIEKFRNEIYNLTAEIKQIETKLWKKNTEEVLKNKISEQVFDAMLAYAPEFSLPKKEKEWAFYNKSDEDDETRKQTYDGSAIILLKSKYKEKIKNELELIGISRKSIYPDMQNKSQYIREKYL